MLRRWSIAGRCGRGFGYELVVQLPRFLGDCLIAVNVSREQVDLDLELKHLEHLLM